MIEKYEVDVDIVMLYFIFPLLIFNDMGTQRLWTALGANSRVHLQIIKQILTKPAGCNS